MTTSPRFRLRIGDRTIALHDGSIYTVGQGEAATVRLVHASVADEHARLVVEDGGVTLEDLGSPHGTHLGGRRIERVRLAPGDRPRFGEVECELLRLEALMPAARTHRPGHHEETFQEIMARELAHAPWFFLSVALHVIVFLLLAWLLEPPPVGTPAKVEATVLAPTQEAEIVAEEEPEPEPEVEVSEREEIVTEPQVEARYMEPTEREPVFDPSAFTEGFEGVGLTAVRGGKGGSDSGDIFGLGSDALRKGALRTTVARLRETGLEIVFVFDSTGSMDRVLSSAKQRMFKMMEALHALVPAARIGIITYRDDGPSEEYLTRSVPVTEDIYRVMNFMHTIQAQGGGDFEEAVFEGLRQATTQRWEPESRRVVVLIGDAPPHRQEEAKLRSAIENFARGQAFVHTIATVEGPRGRAPHPDTKRTFEAIAKAGKGLFSLLEGEDKILQQVMLLAFGSEHRRDLDEIYSLVETRTKKTEVSALDVVQRADLDAVAKALRRKPVDDEMVKAVVKLEKPEVTRFLIEKLGDAGFPPHGRQACSYAVMRILRLRQPPLDPESDKPLVRRQIDDLLLRLD